MPDLEPAAGSRAPLPPVMLLIALAAMAALHVGWPLAHLVPGPYRYGGAALVGLGLVLAAWAAGLFHRAGTSVHPRVASSTLVCHGPFALSRNPMYLGMVLVLGGSALYLGSLTPWGVLPVFVWSLRRAWIEPEERKLAAAFGEGYQRYRDRVRRWL